MKKQNRKHDPNWKDNTSTKRQSKRREKLNQIAGAAGYFSPKTGKPSWSAYETACLNGAAKPEKRSAATPPER
jgi:hypothetical protein